MFKQALWERVREKCVQLVQVRLINVVQLLLKKQQDAFEAVRSGKVVDSSLETAASESVPLSQQGDLSLYTMVRLPT